MNKQEIFDKITNSIIEKLKMGTIPWRKSWRVSLPANFVSKQHYNGINFLYLSLQEYPSPYYITFLQCKQKGALINKGAEGSLILFWQIREIQNKITDKKEDMIKFPMLRYSYVFNISETSLFKITDNRSKIIQAENLLNNLKEKPVLTNNFRQCYYDKNRDIISIPMLKDFDSSEEYYSSLYHEIIHWTGYCKRLNRNLNNDGMDRAFEELVAEIGSAYLCGLSGITIRTLDNHAAYINSWLQAYSKDSLFLIKAAIEAKKAVNFLFGGCKIINKMIPPA